MKKKRIRAILNLVQGVADANLNPISAPLLIT